MNLVQAMQDAVEKTLNNIKRFNGKFPHVSENGIYHLNNNDDWTNGFWTGMLWLSYEYTNEAIFRDAAIKTIESFKKRIEKRTVLDHHDIGFLFSLSSKAHWLIEKDEASRQLSLHAAELLIQRWRQESELIQAWGPRADKKNGGRIIIDCLMNLPLLFWAYEQTNDKKYYDIAQKQLDKSRRYLVRGDDSTYHTFYFDQDTGIPIRGGTEQGYHDGSTWARGQAWGIYGFALAYHYTKDNCYLETSLRLALYFIKHIQNDGVVYWDFNAPIDSHTKRDSSASAIAACGILQLLNELPIEHSKRDYLEQAVQHSLKGMINNYSTLHCSLAEGLLEHGSYHVRGGISPDDYMIWGDYFYMEALMRIVRKHKGYWYE